MIHILNLAIKEQALTSQSLEFAQIEPGTYQRGSPLEEVGRQPDEAQHTVHLTEGFEIGRTQVTQALWYSVMGTNPSRFRYPRHSDGDFVHLEHYKLNLNHPVENVNWDDVQDFIRRLNALDPSYTYRLPTEAEWEYAARAGTDTAYPHGNDPASLDTHAWHGRNSDGRTHAVATRHPNPQGLFDVGGNVWEWTQDLWHATYPSGEVTNPTGPTSGSPRVIRGGGWYSDPEQVRSAARGLDPPSDRGGNLGFRLVRIANR